MEETQKKPRDLKSSLSIIAIEDNPPILYAPTSDSIIINSYQKAKINDKHDGL
jgi:hypothetical protein